MRRESILDRDLWVVEPVDSHGLQRRERPWTPGCPSTNLFFNALIFTAVLTLGTKYAHRSAERMLPLAPAA